MIKIIVKKEFKDDYITRVAGERLRLMILGADKKNEKVEIDFTGVVIASTSFFDEGFAKLVEHGWTRSKLDSQVVLKNINEMDRNVLIEMCRNRAMK